MSINVGKEIAALQRMAVKDLRTKYAELFGDETRTRNKPWLIKRIVWRLQALAEGGLSGRARQRAAELVNEADLRMSPPKPKPLSATAESTVTLPFRKPGDRRLPPPGTVLTRAYKGQTLQVQVLKNGFEYEGEMYPSLSAVAKVITGSHCNGYLFFRLSRSLLDFARMMATFDKQHVAFVSVTQQFNTTSSMGRLVLREPSGISTTSAAKPKNAAGRIAPHPRSLPPRSSSSSWNRSAASVGIQT